MAALRKKKGEFNEATAITPATPLSAEQKELLLLLSHLKRAPKLLQDVFAPCFEKSTAIITLVNTCTEAKNAVLFLQQSTTQKWEITKNQMLLFTNYLNMLEIKVLRETFTETRASIQGVTKAELSLLFKNYKMYKQTAKLNLVQPLYRFKEKIAKSTSKKEIELKFQNIEQGQSLFSAEPRFINKIDELNNFCNHDKQENNIFLLEYEGNFITGNKSYAVVRDKQFEIWNMETLKHPFSKQARDTVLQKKPITNEESFSLDELTEDDELPHATYREPLLKRNFTYVGHTQRITCASFSADEYYIVTGSADRSIKLWCLRLNILLAEFRCHSKTIWSVDFNPSGFYFLSGSADGMAALWRTNTHSPVRLLKHSSDVFKVAFAKNPSYAITACYNGFIMIWNLIEAQITKKIKLANPVVNFTLGYSGKYLISIETDGRITIHNILEGTIESTFYFYSQKKVGEKQKKTIVHDACFSDNEQEIALVTSDYILKYHMNQFGRKNCKSIYEQESIENIFPEMYVNPHSGIVSNKSTRFTFCKYSNFGLLVVGGCKEHIKTK